MTYTRNQSFTNFQAALGGTSSSTGVKCPACDSLSEVLETRPTTGGVRRRRKCLTCETRFSTYELNVDEIDFKLRRLEYLEKQFVKIQILADEVFQEGVEEL